ncbi:MAG: hypothetical protein V7603_2587 [Micromonosporaceae bacterium]
MGRPPWRSSAAADQADRTWYGAVVHIAAELYVVAEHAEQVGTGGRAGRVGGTHADVGSAAAEGDGPARYRPAGRRVGQDPTRQVGATQVLDRSGTAAGLAVPENATASVGGPGLAPLSTLTTSPVPGSVCSMATVGSNGRYGMPVPRGWTTGPSSAPIAVSHRY